MNTIISEKTVSAFEARRKFGNILREIEVKRDKFVVERHGEPVAALVPIEVYQQWKKTRSEFFAQIRSYSHRANITEEEADKVISQAISAIRKHKNT